MRELAAPPPADSLTIVGNSWSKLKQFLAGADPDRFVVHPWPWENASRPYHVANRPDDPDGYGGYSRNHRIDDDGLPYYATPSGRLYDPLVVARFGLKMLAIADATADASVRHRARGVAPALIASARSTGAWGRGGAADAMSTDRPSGLVQGVVLSALLRLSDIPPDRELEGVVDRAFARLAAPVERGGTVARLDGGPFFEEFPRLPPSHILNGCIYALLGVYDLADSLGHREAQDLARAAESGMARSARRFVTKTGWSRYALGVYGHAPLASLHYHVAHIVLLDVLAQRTGESEFARVSDVWRRSLLNPGVRVLNASFKAALTFWMRNVRSLPLQDS
ncbi:MAG: hypothetical protein KBD01_13390 [Acidobacteria bacterium]|nr:hypothetical protein [Acidobacteriota bacterium]